MRVYGSRTDHTSVHEVFCIVNKCSRNMSKKLLLVAIFCAFTWYNVAAALEASDPHEHARVKRSALSDEDRKAAYEAALPKNQKHVKTRSKVDRDDIDHAGDAKSRYTRDGQTRATNGKRLKINV